MKNVDVTVGDGTSRRSWRSIRAVETLWEGQVGDVEVVKTEESVRRLFMPGCRTKGLLLVVKVKVKESTKVACERPMILDLGTW